MNCLQSGWAHIFARENRAIFKGDSFAESFLLGFSANTAQSEINFRRDCKGKDHPRHYIKVDIIAFDCVNRNQVI